ncbi:MAG: protein arginine kinase [Thermaerobacter sp.]|nr:protein arginine kinase [Thermaerobacter sp.]
MPLKFSQWMDGVGPDADIVLSSRIRLARNLAGLPFPHRMDEAQSAILLEQITEAVRALEPQWAVRIQRLADLTAVERMGLVERHLVSPQLVQEPIRFQSVAINERESVSLMVGEEDHVRIQMLWPALQLEEAWRAANHVDDALESRLSYAFDGKIGYLTACPTNVGTAMRASVMLHLPALVMTRQAPQVFTTLAQIGMVVRGLYGEGSEALGNIFQVSNQVSLGLAEDEFIHNLTVVAQQIIGRERHARMHLLQNAEVALADRVGRAWGLLTNARIMTSEEALRLLSEVKLGQELGLLTETVSATFAQLTTMTRSASLQMMAGRDLGPDERDEFRATTLRTHLLGKD